MNVNLERLRKTPHRKVPYVKAVWREEWNAEPPLETEDLKLPVKNVVLTYTETKPCKTDEACLKAVQDLQHDQMAAGAKDIHWNFLVGGNGKVYEGRGWVVNAQKAPKYSELEGTSLDIAYIASERKHVTEEMKFVKGQLIRLGLIEYVVNDSFHFYEDKIDRTVMKDSENDKDRKSVRKGKKDDDDNSDDESDDSDDHKKKKKDKRKSSRERRKARKRKHKRGSSSSDDDSSDEDSSDEDSSDKDSSDEDSSGKDSSDEESLDEDSSDEDSSD